MRREWVTPRACCYVHCVTARGDETPLHALDESVTGDWQQVAIQTHAAVVITSPT